MKCYIWNCFVIPVFFFFFCHQSKNDDAKWNHSISEAKYNESWKSVLPPTLDPTRQQHLIRYSIILKWLFPAGGAPLSSFYDRMSSTFTGQLLNQSHSKVAFFYSKVGSGRNIRANDVNFNLFTQRFMVSSNVFLISNANCSSLN